MGIAVLATTHSRHGPGAQDEGLPFLLIFCHRDAGDGDIGVGQDNPVAYTITARVAGECGLACAAYGGAGIHTSGIGILQQDIPAPAFQGGQELIGPA